MLACQHPNGPPVPRHVNALGPLPPQMLYGPGDGLAEAPTAIHRAEVVHRDLKPGNVLLTTAGPKVIDFDIAQAMDAISVTRTGMTVGSPGFMAPENPADRPTARELLGWLTREPDTAGDAPTQ